MKKKEGQKTELNIKKPKGKNNFFETEKERKGAKKCMSAQKAQPACKGEKKNAARKAQPAWISLL